MFKSNFLIKSIIDKFEAVCGTNVNTEERAFISIHFDIELNGIQKEIYYYAIAKLKRNEEFEDVKLYVYTQTKNFLLESNAPESLINLSDEISHIIYFDALKKYCKLDS